MYNIVIFNKGDKTMDRNFLLKMRKLFDFYEYEHFFHTFALILFALPFLVLHSNFQALLLISLFLFAVYSFSLIYLSKKYEYEAFKNPYERMKRETNHLSTSKLMSLLIEERNYAKENLGTDILDSFVMFLDELLWRRLKAEKNIAELIKCLELTQYYNDKNMKDLINKRLQKVEPNPVTAYSDKDSLLSLLSRINKTIETENLIINE